jgi:hypothetical protein
VAVEARLHVGADGPRPAARPRNDTGASYPDLAEPETSVQKADKPDGALHACRASGKTTGRRRILSRAAASFRRRLGDGLLPSGVSSGKHHDFMGPWRETGLGGRDRPRVPSTSARVASTSADGPPDVGGWSPRRRVMVGVVGQWLARRRRMVPPMSRRTAATSRTVAEACPTSAAMSGNGGSEVPNGGREVPDGGRDVGRGWLRCARRRRRCRAMEAPTCGGVLIRTT